MNTVPEQEKSSPLRVVHLAKDKLSSVNVFEQFSLQNTNTANLQRFFFLQMERTGQFTHKTFMLSRDKLEKLALPGSRLWLELQKKKKRYLSNAFDRMFFKLWAELYKTQHILYRRAAYAEKVIDEILENADSEELSAIKDEVTAVKEEIAENIRVMDREQKPPAEPTRETYQRINQKAHMQETLLARLYARIMSYPEAEHVNIEEQEVEQPHYRPYEYEPNEFSPYVYRTEYKRVQRKVGQTGRRFSTAFSNLTSRRGTENEPEDVSGVGSDENTDTGENPNESLEPKAA